MNVDSKRSSASAHNFNYYSAYDWSVWLVYGSQPFLEGSASRKVPPDSDKELLPSGTDLSTVVAATKLVLQDSTTVNIVSTVDDSATPVNVDISVPNDHDSTKINTTVVAHDIFDSVEEVVKQSLVALVVGANLAFIKETSAHQAAAREAAMKSKLEMLSQNSQTGNVSANIKSFDVSKPEFHSPDLLGKKVIHTGVQMASLTAAMSITIEVNDHLLKRQRDVYTYSAAGAVGGFVMAVTMRPFAFSRLVVVPAIMAVGGVGYYAFDQRFGKYFE